jgi:hypothetical protein
MPKKQPCRKPTGLSPAAMEEFYKKWKAAEERVKKEVSLTILVWGPNQYGKSAVARKRRQIRDELRAKGHIALFSEEVSSVDGRSLSLQELIQTKIAHLIIVLVGGSDGVISEVSLFCTLPGVFEKIFVMIPAHTKVGFFTEGPISMLEKATSGGGVYRYHAEELTSCQVLAKALERAEGLRSLISLHS